RRSVMNWPRVGLTWNRTSARRVSTRKVAGACAWSASVGSSARINARMTRFASRYHNGVPHAPCRRRQHPWPFGPSRFNKPDIIRLRSCGKLHPFGVPDAQRPSCKNTYVRVSAFAFATWTAPFPVGGGTAGHVDEHRPDADRERRDRPRPGGGCRSFRFEPLADRSRYWRHLGKPRCGEEVGSQDRSTAYSGNWLNCLCAGQPKDRVCGNGGAWLQQGCLGRSWSPEIGRWRDELDA